MHPEPGVAAKACTRPPLIRMNVIQLPSANVGIVTTAPFPRDQAAIAARQILLWIDRASASSSYARTDFALRLNAVTLTSFSSR